MPHLQNYTSVYAHGRYPPAWEFIGMEFSIQAGFEKGKYDMPVDNPYRARDIQCRWISFPKPYP